MDREVKATWYVTQAIVVVNSSAEESNLDKSIAQLPITDPSDQMRIILKINQ